MPDDRVFFDTNILVYAFAPGDPRRDAALQLLLGGGIIGVQTLNEFVNVSAGKLKKTWAEIRSRIEAIQSLCEPPVPVTLNTHHRGTTIAEATGYHIYDSLMLAAAIEASCTVFYSEDMQDGQMIGSLLIRNPFQRRR